jgi:hypothetical protein
MPTFGLHLVEIRLKTATDSLWRPTRRTSYCFIIWNPQTNQIMKELDRREGSAWFLNLSVPIPTS